MNLNSLTAVSPIDGRYRNKTKEFSNYFSEYALIKYRVRVEIEYFIALAKYKIPQLSDLDNETLKNLRYIYLDFSLNDAEKIKNIEKITNHDVKAVEYFIKEKFDELNISKYKEFIHFGLTSQDINNTATPLSLKEAVSDIYLPQISAIIVHVLICIK